MRLFGSGIPATSAACHVEFPKGSSLACNSHWQTDATKFISMAHMATVVNQGEVTFVSSWSFRACSDSLLIFFGRDFSGSMVEV